MNRVVITGMGVVAPNGFGVEEFWNALISGKSGIKAIESFDTSEFSVKIAGEIRGLSLDNYMDPKEARRTDRFVCLGIVAADLFQRFVNRVWVEAKKEVKGGVKREGAGISSPPDSSLN